MIKRLTSFITLFLLLLILTACNNAVNDPKVDGVVIGKLTDTGEAETFRTISVENDADAVSDIQKIIQGFKYDNLNTDDVKPTYQFYLNYDDDGNTNAIPKPVVYTLGKTTDGEHVVIGEGGNFDNVDVLDEDDSKELYHLLIGEMLD